jgi:hypothetical protein
MGSVRNAKTPNVRIVLRFIIAGFVAVRGEAEGDRLVGAVCLIVEGVLAI